MGEGIGMWIGTEDCVVTPSPSVVEKTLPQHQSWPSLESPHVSNPPTEIDVSAGAPSTRVGTELTVQSVSVQGASRSKPQQYAPPPESTAHELYTPADTAAQAMAPGSSLGMSSEAVGS